MEQELRKIEPGTVIRFPESLRQVTGGAEFGIFTGAEYDQAQEKAVFPRVEAFMGTQGFRSQAIASRPENEAWEVRANDTVLTAFQQKKLEVPYLDVTHGTDPEIFCTEHDGVTVIPAWRYLYSEQEADAWFSSMDDEDPKRFWDGVQAEWCPPSSRLTNRVLEGLHNGMRQIRAAARRVSPDAQLSISSTATLTKEQIATANPAHLAFRCSPSFNVYGDEGMAPPDATQFFERYAGGHLHGGISRKYTIPVIDAIVQALDGILGVAGVSLAAGMDDPRRRRYYGRAGEFRLPKHGIEYRVLSNFWLCHPAITDLVMEMFHRVMAFGANGLYKVAWKADQNKVREVINNCNVEQAREMLNENRGVLLTLANQVWAPRVANAAVECLLNGVRYAVENPADLMKNWHLEDNKWEKYARQPGGSWESLTFNQLFRAPSAEEQAGKLA